MSGNSCQSYVPCQNGHIWDSIRFTCNCPDGEQSNGYSCVQCSGGKKWIDGIGCRCPEGDFDLGSKCEQVDQSRCMTIPKAFWDQTKCICQEGYTKVGLQCVCYGIEVGNMCDRCSHKSNSVWDGYLCKCQAGFTEIGGKCISDTTGKGSDDPNSCAVGSYFDSNHRKCLACPDGCLSCIDCYTCVQCRPEFNFNPHYNLCFEKCGDGKKFVLECDDGNSADNDGCSRDCHIEQGHTCTGGSPDTPDNCFIFQPGQVTLSLSGQIRMETSMILNVRLDYLPQALLQSADCNNKCFNVLVGEIMDGDKAATSITSEYLPGSTYSFAVKVEFGRSYIGKFTIKISIDRAIGLKYFGQVSASQSIDVDVQPSFLSKVNGESELH